MGQSLWTNLFDLWQPVTPRSSPATSLGTLLHQGQPAPSLGTWPQQAAGLLGRPEGVCGSGTLYTVGVLFSWNQPCPMMTHKGMRSGNRQLSSTPVPGLCPPRALLQPPGLPGATRGEPGNRPSCKLFEGRECVSGLVKGSPGACSRLTGSTEGLPSSGSPVEPGRGSGTQVICMLCVMA